MHIYFACGAKEYFYLLLQAGVKKILVSLAYPEPYKCKQTLKRHNIRFMVDSGAFTAWTLGKEVKIDDYIDFLNKHKDVIDINRVTSLDVIKWGEKGSIKTSQDYEEGVKAGYENWLYLKKKGWNTIPVFHQGENFVWLEKYLNEAHIVGISQNKDLPYRDVDRWYYEVFYTIKKIGKLNIKTHAFGMTSPEMLRKYPFDSADSATWALTSAMGTILTPYGRYYVSEEKQFDSNHIENLNPAMRKPVLEYIESFGFNYDTIKKKENGYKFRNLINIEYFLKLEEELTKNPVVFSDHQKPLFDFMELHREDYNKSKQDET